MSYLTLLLFAIAGLTSAAPGQLLSKRRLHSSEITRDAETGCPAYLEPGQYEFPHYITQISAKHPDVAFGPSYDGVFSPNDISTIFSFDVPASRYNDTCTLEFLFPSQDQLTTSSYTYSGGGTFFNAGYAIGDCPGPQTTYNNQPAPGPFPPFPPLHMEPGFAYVLDIGPCRFSAGSCVAGRTYTNDTHFKFFQDDGACPIGVYTAYSTGS